MKKSKSNIFLLTVILGGLIWYAYSKHQEETVPDCFSQSSQKYTEDLILDELREYITTLTGKSLADGVKIVDGHMMHASTTGTGNKVCRFVGDITKNGKDKLEVVSVVTIEKTSEYGVFYYTSKIVTLGGQPLE